VLYETFARKIWEILEKKYLTKNIETQLPLKRKFYCFQLKRGLSIDDQMNNYMKLLIDLINVDVVIEEEDKAVILLNSLPDEQYETFVLTLIYDNKTLKYSDVSSALINYEVRRKDKQSSSKSTSAEALSSSKREKGDHDRSKCRPGFMDLKKTSAPSTEN